MNETHYLASKQRFDILDGLRGVAALVVVGFHLFETYSKGPQYQILNHGYLAVDFFFLLSGYVMGYAYDDRWNKMSMKDFFKRRIVRLHPMVIAGSIIGALLFYVGSSASFPLIDQTPWWKMLLVMLVTFTMIPILPKFDIRGWGETNPLNGPAWTLLYEYIANILYAVFIRRFSKTVLTLFVIFAALLTINLGMNLDVFGVLQDRNNPMYTTAYTFIGGWNIDIPGMLVGFTRLLYPFLMGLLLSRLKKVVKVKSAFSLCSFVIFILLVMPHLGGQDFMWINGLYDVICILIIFPFIVTVGAGSEVTGKAQKICKFVGEISYPLFITHYPLVYIQMAWKANHPDAPLSQIICVSVGLLIVAIGNAYALMKLYDAPVREWLKQHWLMKKA